MPDYYGFPVSFKSLITGKKLRKLSLEDSVDQHISLILVTRFEEFKYDPTFGCTVWDYDFEALPKINSWKNEMEHSIAKLLDALEPRLANVVIKVNISLEEVTAKRFKNVRRVKRRINIAVKGRLVPTDEVFERLDYSLFFSPISLD